MDYTKLTQEELINLLEDRDGTIEDYKDSIQRETLETPDISTMVSLYESTYNISFDFSDVEGADIKSLSKDANNLLDTANDLLDTQQKEYVSSFITALRFASTHNVRNEEWSPEAWFREASKGGISSKQILTGFLIGADQKQQEYIMNNYFTVKEGKNLASTYQLGFVTNEYTLVSVIDNIDNSYISPENKFKILSSLYDFAKENNYSNVNSIESKIKDKMLSPVRMDYNKNLIIENLKNDNKFGITSEDINLRTHIENINGRIARTIKDDPNAALEACSFLEKLANSGIWDKQIIESKDNEDFQSNASQNAPISHIEDVRVYLHDVAKERFDNILEQRYLTLSTDETFKPTQKRKGPSM